MSRRLATAVTAAALLASASPASALSPATYPTGAGPVIPGTSRAVDTWKLVGTWQTSAIQLAPRWVLSSDHSSIPVGETFRNAYGTATVLQQYRPTIGFDDDGNGIDLTLHYLSAPITGAPSYPKILDTTVNGGFDDSLPGWLLNVGYGLNGTTPPNTTTPVVGWSTTYGLTTVGGTTDLIATGGDSGGAQFWFPSATAAPVLAGVMTYGGPTSLGVQQNVGGTQFHTNERIRDFMDAAFASRAAEPGATAPTFTTVEQQVGPVTGLRPGGVLAYADMTGATKVRVAWHVMETSPVPRSGYRVYFNGVLKATVGPSATNVTVTGLQWLKKYTVRVAPYNASGEAVSIPRDDTFVTTTIL